MNVYETVFTINVDQKGIIATINIITIKWQ